MSEGQASKTPWIVVAVVVLVIAGVGFWWMKGGSSAATKTGVKSAGSSGYQAVFLGNGQVYFGKLSDVSSDFVTLKDVYYLQVSQSPIQGSKDVNGNVQTQPQISLVKLGQELHAPEDKMAINRNAILFYEDMTKEAKVVDAISKYVATQKDGSADKGSVAPASTTTPAATTPAATTPAATTPAATTPAAKTPAAATEAGN